jgi:DNA-binding LacI/PurR family transcriptional regulator
MSLEQVAKRARVSTATVSRVLNGVDVVKNSTRARVMKAVSELKYHPNLHARSLAGGRSRTVGVIVSNLDNPFFLDVYRAVETDCHARGYELIVANTLYRSEQLAASTRMMLGRRVAGLAVIVSEMDENIITELTESEIPIVFYDVGTPAEISPKSASTTAKAWSGSLSIWWRSATWTSPSSDITPFSVPSMNGGGR